MSDSANKAVAHLLDRAAHDPKLAYYIGPFTESFRLLSAARAEQLGLDVESFRRNYVATLKTQPPICKECGEAAQ